MSATVGSGAMKYTPSHLWVRVEGDEAVVGLTAYGQDKQGKVNYIGLPAVGAPLTFGMPFAYLQAAAYGLVQLFPPVQGEVTEINEDLWARPALVNEAAEGDGWLVRVKLSNPAEVDELEDEAAYEGLITSPAPRPVKLPSDLQTSKEPAFLIDQHRRVLDANAAAEALIGLRSKDLQHTPLCQELFGCRHDDASHEPVDKGSCPGLCSMLNLEPVSETYEVTNASGQPTRVEAQYTPIAQPGEPRRAIVTLTVLD